MNGRYAHYKCRYWQYTIHHASFWLYPLGPKSGFTPMKMGSKNGVAVFDYPAGAVRFLSGRVVGVLAVGP
jgi:hypothetical protein